VISERDSGGKGVNRSGESNVNQAVATQGGEICPDTQSAPGGPYLNRIKPCAPGRRMQA